jgi:hypothetical protein
VVKKNGETYFAIFICDFPSLHRIERQFRISTGLFNDCETESQIRVEMSDPSSQCGAQKLLSRESPRGSI